MTQPHDSQLEEALDAAARLIAGAKYTIALVGAGMSVESGIPTYRGPGGLWTRFGEPPMNAYQQFLQNPVAWWEEQIDPAKLPEHRKELYKALQSARPNGGHYALVDMERMGVLKHIITQNVDNLHQVAGSANVAEIHGNRTKLRCIQCGYRRPRQGFEVDDLPPHCPQCNGIVKGDTVMFGEPIPGDVLNACIREASRCDCMLLIGTSATVYPAAGFPEEVVYRGGHIIEVNPNPTPFSDVADVVLRNPSAEALPRVVQKLKDLRS